MFRIISQSGISAVKTKVGSQVGQAATRNTSLNITTRRLNSTVHSAGIDQDILKPQNNYKGNYRKTNNFRNKNPRKPLFNNEIPLGKDNPLYHQLTAFEDCVNYTTGNKLLNTYNPQFWECINKAMELYHELSGTPDFNAERVSKLVYLLHTGLRQNRSQTLKLDKKPDFDAKNFHKDMMDYINLSLREISADIISNKNKINEYGAMHLITSFKELQLTSEAISIWENSRNSASGHIFLDPRVVGVILPLMYENGHSFAEIQELFETSKGQISYYHPNLGVGMIRVCLLANEINFALRLFEELCGNSQSRKFGYLTETHLSFIGESNDLSVANAFFEKALNDEMPYKIDLQVPYIKKFIVNTWSQTKDFNQVLNIWIKCWNNYGTKVNKGVSSSLNELFLSIFFTCYENNKVEGFAKLKDIIAMYGNIKPLDEPFLNIIMSKCVCWNDEAIINEVLNYYHVYNVTRTQVAYRVALKAMGSVAVDDTIIIAKWNELLQFSDFQGASFIHNADWAALRDATIGSSQYGEQRVNLYAAMVKQYCRMSKDLRQIKVLTEVNLTRFPFIATAMSYMDSIDTTQLNPPTFKNIRELY